MATLIDEPVEATEDTTLETQEAKQPEQPVETQPEADIPEKYKGKSIADIARMHQEAERLIGKQSGEVGELRRVVDDFILQSKSEEAQEPAPKIDFFENPEEAVNQAVQNHPDVVEAREARKANQKQTALAQLQQRHPDMKEILEDSKFQEWISSSKVRQQMLRQADTAMDFEVADEIFSNWKERQQLVTQTVQSETANRKSTVNKASTGSTSGSAEQSSKKIYRSADIRNLMIKDPERYEALNDELMLAYAEGRVR